MIVLGYLEDGIKSGSGGGGGKNGRVTGRAEPNTRGGSTLLPIIVRDVSGTEDSDTLEEEESTR